MNDDAHQGDSEQHAVLLLPGWRHPRTERIHIRRDCRAVEFYRGNMTPILVRMDDEAEVGRVLGSENLCPYCFDGF